MISNTIPTIAEIHNGEVTHHHDQFATGSVPVNLRAKNRMKIIPTNPIPPPELELFDIVLLI